MKVKMLVVSALLIGMLINTVGCKSQKQTVSNETKPKIEMGSYALPPVIVYKMAKDYSNFVPVTMNQDKTKIISYPANIDISDVVKPTPLADGYWLDRRGITNDVAFLKYTYEEYSKLDKTPTMETLMQNILEKNPLLEIYYCGQRNEFKDDLVSELNQKIKESNGDLSKIFKSIK